MSELRYAMIRDDEELKSDEARGAEEIAGARGDASERVEDEMMRR